MLHHDPSSPLLNFVKAQVGPFNSYFRSEIIMNERREEFGYPSFIILNIL